MMPGCAFESALREAAKVDHWDGCEASEWDYGEDRWDREQDAEREAACDCSLSIAAKGLRADDCAGRESALRELVDNFGCSEDCRCPSLLACLYDDLEDEGDGPAWDKARSCISYGGAVCIALKNGCQVCRPSAATSEEVKS